jgi:arylsulfatase
MVSQNRLLETLPDNFYMTDALTDSALQFLGEGAENQKPFFLYLAYTAPHWPLHADSLKAEKYKGRYLHGWDAVRTARHQRQVALGLFPMTVALSPRDSLIPSWDQVRDKDTWDLKMAAYAAMIESVDDGVGRIVSYLSETNQLENTLIMFLSDNGGCHETIAGRMDKDLGAMSAWARTRLPGEKGSYMAYGMEWANACNTPFRMYKHWTHEGGISSPFIVSYPHLIEEGKIVSDMAHVIDIMPTVMEVSGAVYPTDKLGKPIPPASGKSLMPVLYNQQWSGHEYLYWEHEGSRAIRKGKWKLVSLPNGSWELYDMDADRSELNDLSEVWPDTVSTMRDRYQEWADRVGVRP